jgi:lipopolysaccharide export system ATP-binding protein
MRSILEIDSVTRSFGDKQVLTDIYLRCETGDIIGLLGRNGSGKSTLLKILFGSGKSHHKFIRIDDVIYDKPYQSPGIISYLPQESFLLSHLTVAQTVKLYLPQQTELFLEDGLLSKLSGNKINSLSGGELRYLEIKLLLHLPSKFLLMDEPFNGVAPVMVETLKAMIIEHSKTKGIILTDHDYVNVLDVATKYCLLHDGNIKEIKNREGLIQWQYLTINSLE